jgi:hypothetical protein
MMWFLQGWDELMTDLLLPDANRSCDVGVAGISATSERMAAGAIRKYKGLLIAAQCKQQDLCGAANGCHPHTRYVAM